MSILQSNQSVTEASTQAKFGFIKKPSEDKGMKDILDKALEEHKLNIDCETPKMKWIYKHP